MAKASILPAISCWGTPDPRDGDDYPKTTTSMIQWGWEFLRRRDDYRERWRELVQPFIKDDRWDLEAEDRELQAKGILYVSRLVSFGGEFRITPSFGNFFLDPRSSRPPVFDHRAVESIGPRLSMINLPIMSFVFDVRSSLDPQLAYVRQKLMEGARKWSQSNDQEPPGKLHRHVDKYSRYLRLLDFKERCIRSNEIGRYLFPRKSGEELRGMISKNWISARRCQKDYFSIVFGSLPK